MCTCNPRSAALCDVALADAYRILGDATPANFLTRAVHWMEFEQRANIARIVTDQWALVVIERYPVDVGEPGNWKKPVEVARIQCDRVEHGIARAVQALAAGEVVA